MISNSQLLIQNKLSTASRLCRPA